MNQQPHPIYQHPELDGTDFFWPGSRIGILLIHGFTATSVEVRSLATILHNQGYTVGGPLLPGHGTSPQDLNRATVARWEDTVQRKYEQIKSQCDVIFVGGESMGGLLSLDLALKFPEIKGILLYAPALRIKNIGMAPLLAPFKEYLWKSNYDDSMSWQGYTVTPLKGAAQLRKLQQKVDRNLQKIQQPVAIFQGMLDKTIEIQSSQIIYDRIGSKDKRLHWMQNSTHCILLDRELPDVAQMSLDFIKRLSPASE